MQDDSKSSKSTEQHDPWVTMIAEQASPMAARYREIYPYHDAWVCATDGYRVHIAPGHADTPEAYSYINMTQMIDNASTEIRSRYRRRYVPIVGKVRPVYGDKLEKLAAIGRTYVKWEWWADAVSVCKPDDQIEVLAGENEPSILKLHLPGGRTAYLMYREGIKEAHKVSDALAAKIDYWRERTNRYLTLQDQKSYLQEKPMSEGGYSDCPALLPEHLCACAEHGYACIPEPYRSRIQRIDRHLKRLDEQTKRLHNDITRGLHG